MSAPWSPTRPIRSASRAARAAAGSLVGKTSPAVPGGRFHRRHPRHAEGRAGRSRCNKRSAGEPRRGQIMLAKRRIAKRRRKQKMSSANAEAGRRGSLVGRLNLQQYVVYFGFLAIFLFFAVMLRRQRLPHGAQPVEHRPADGAGDDHGDRSGVRHVGGRDRSLDRLDRRRRRAGCRGGDEPLRHGGRGGRRPRLRARHRPHQRPARRLRQAAVFPGHAGDSWPVCRRLPLDDRSTLDPGDRPPVHRPLRLGNPARRAFADLVDGACHPCRPPCLPRDPLRCTCARHRRQSRARRAFPASASPRYGSPC